MNRRGGRLLCASLAILLLSLAVFWPVAGQGFLSYDDESYVSKNPWVTAGLTVDGIRRAFTSPSNVNWHPLTVLSHMAGAELFGLWPGGHHLINLGLHIINAVLLLLVFQAMTAAFRPAALVAALFAIHPLHVESVAWISGRKDVLSTLFWMLTLGAYLRYAARPGLWRYLAVLAAMALGLMAKPLLVTMPFVLLLLDYWPLGRLKPGSSPGINRRAGMILAEKAPLLLLAAGSSVLTYFVQQGGGAMTMLESPPPLGIRLANAAAAYGTYILRLFWPSGLSFHYPYVTGAALLWKAAASLLLLAGVTALTLRWRASRPYLALGWFWFLGTLVPMIGLVQVGNQAMADRYTYVSLIGLFVMLAWGAAECAAAAGRERILAPAGGIVVLALMVPAGIQVGHWRDDSSLYSHGVAANPEDWIARNNLGSTLLLAGKQDQAAAHFAAVNALKPDYAPAHFNLGLILQARGDADGAADRYREALRLYPSLYQAHFNLARILAARGDSWGAIEHYSAAAGINPHMIEAHIELGAQLRDQGRLADAAACFAKVIAISPENPEARYNQGVVLAKWGRYEESVASLREALRLSPGHRAAQDLLGMLVATGKAK